MWESTGGEQNKPMSLKIICSFKRMRQFQPYSAVVAALKESNFLVVEGEEGNETVRRRKAYVSSTEAQKARLAASIYAKGFGEEEPSTQFDIEAFFAKYGHVKLVKLRRTAEEVFKGSVFVEFASAEEADAFVNLDPKPTWKGNELLVMKKQAYLDEKNRQIKEGLIEPNTNRRRVFFEGREKGGIRGGRGGQQGRSGDDKNKDGDKKNGFKGGRGGRGRGRGGRNFRGGRNGNASPRDKKKEETRTSTNEYVSLPCLSNIGSRSANHPFVFTASNSRPSNPRKPATESALARTTPLPTPRPPRRSIPSRSLSPRNEGRACAI
jgi:lupus La protein